MLIDKHKIYELDNYKFVNFIMLDEDTIKNIRIWRNHPDIRKFMYNQNEISVEEHDSFIRQLPARKDKSYWLVYRNDNPIGVINLVDIDYDTSKAELGYYLIPDQLKSGLGVEFLIKVHFFFFMTLRMDCIYGGTNINNTNALILNQFLCGELGESFIEKGEEYIRHYINKENFLKNRQLSDNMRTFVRYCKSYDKN